MSDKVTQQQLTRLVEDVRSEGTYLRSRIQELEARVGRLERRSPADPVCGACACPYISSHEVRCGLPSSHPGDHQTGNFKWVPHD